MAFLLESAPFGSYKFARQIRRKWLHYENLNDLDKIGADAYYCFINSTLQHYKNTGLDIENAKHRNNPLVSIITPLYNTTHEQLQRAYDSLCNQTYSNWEWVLVDDSEVHIKEKLEIISYDKRIVYIPYKHSGVIGEVKYMGCVASRGDLLLELDHDDALTERCLESVVKAYIMHPDVGFFYTDFSELNDNTGESLCYQGGWGFGYGSYREETYLGNKFQVVNSPNINPKTIRHLVAAPNHARVWTRRCYMEIGGHNRSLHVADDFELLIKTFLHTKMCRVPILGYLQYMLVDNSNTQRVRNKEIQRLVRSIRNFYDLQIHERFLELGLDDFVWDDKNGWSDLSIPNSKIEQVASIIYRDAK